MMKLSLLSVSGAAVLAALSGACSSSTQPSGGTASVTTPTPMVPAASAQIQNAAQPITLIVKNAVVTQSSGTTYLFEVATDAAFTNKVQTKGGIAENSSGQTTVALDTLPAAKDYYWHAQATGGGTSGPFSPPSKFTVGPAVVVSSPAPISPLTGAQVPTRPTLLVANAARTGPAGPITYKFEVSSTSAFTSTVLSVTVSEGVNQTGYIFQTDLAINTTYYWRATAIDAANGVSSTPSPINSFTTQQPSQAQAIATQIGIVLWPGAVPTGAVGHATMGNDPNFGAGWAPQTLYYAPQGVFFPSPDAEMLRIFDLLDRGFDPQSAIDWMNSNGYPTAALWYPPPEKAVIGLHYVYLASRGKVVTNSIWDIVVRVE